MWRVYNENKQKWVDVKCLKIVKIPEFPKFVFFAHRVIDKKDLTGRKYALSEKESGAAVSRGNKLLETVYFGINLLLHRTNDEIQTAINQAIERRSK